MQKYINQITSSILFLLVLITFGSCSNDFLNVKQTVELQLQDTILMTNLDPQLAVNFNLQDAGNKHWRIQQFPAWLTVSPLEGNFSDSKSSFQLQIPVENAIPQWGMFSIPLVFEVEGFGLVQYPFHFINFGRPNIGYNPKNMVLDHQSSGIITIENWGEGIMVWEIKDKPAWLTVSKQNGYLEPGKSEQLTVLISRGNLAKGDYSGQINIAVIAVEENLKINVSMKVTDPTISGIVENIDGDVVDADFCKATGLMVVAAKNPNRLYLFKTGQAVKTMDMDKIPKCVTVSETGNQIAAVFTNTDLSLINPENMTITRNIKTGIIASDVALGANDWAYLSPQEYYTSYLLSVDLNSGQVVKNDVNLNGLTLLKKVPGKNLLYGSQVGYSTDGLFVFDISKGAADNIVDQWWVNLRKFWLSEDGLSVYTGIRKIYQSPDYRQKGYIMDTPVLSGELEPVSGSITAMDHCQLLKELLVANKSFNSQLGTRILRIDDSGFLTKNAFTVGNCVAVENGTTLSLIPEVSYMYVNKSGKELNLIKKGVSNIGQIYWSYEKIILK